MLAVLKFLLIISYIIACGALVFSVLVLQQGKGASLGASLGGGASQTVFGSSGSNFMGRITAVMAGVYMVLALVLAKYPPFGTDSSSNVRDILTPEEVESVETPVATSNDLEAEDLPPGLPMPAASATVEIPAAPGADLSQESASEPLPADSPPIEASDEPGPELTPAEAMTAEGPADATEGETASADAPAPVGESAQP